MHRGVQVLDDVGNRLARPPQLGVLELDHGLEHVQSRRVRGGLGASRLPEHLLDFRDGSDHAVGLLEQLARLGHGDSRKDGGHVEEVALEQRRHEFAAQVVDGPSRGAQHHERGQQGLDRMAQHHGYHGVVDAHQETVEGILLFGRNLSRQEQAHQHRHQGHRQERGRGHGPGLGESERAEEPSFLGLQREDRKERHGDEKERPEERRPHLQRAFQHDGPAVPSLLDRFLLLVLQVFVGILHQNDGRVDHGPDGDGESTQAHDVGAHALQAHDKKCHEQRHGQGDDRHQRRARVEQEDRAHKGDDRHFLQQLQSQVFDGPIDQGGAVVQGDDLDVFRQRRLQLLELLLHAFDGGLGVLGVAHDHDSRHHVALPVQIRESAAHGRTFDDARDVGEAHHRPGERGSRGGRAHPSPIATSARSPTGWNWNVSQIFQRAHLAARADHPLGLGRLDGLATGVGARAAQGRFDIRQTQTASRERDLVHADLELAHHAAHRGDFRDPGHGLQFGLHGPVLDAPQLLVVDNICFFACPIPELGPSGAEWRSRRVGHQGVLVHPAHARGVGSQSGLDSARKIRSHGREHLLHPGTRPVEVGALLEDHVGERLPEERIPPHHAGPGSGHQPPGKRLGHLVLHHLRRGTFPGSLHDHLRIGEIGDGVQGNGAQCPDPTQHQEHAQKHHQEPVLQRPRDHAAHGRQLPFPVHPSRRLRLLRMNGKSIACDSRIHFPAPFGFRSS
jgi:hypothetical protein